MKVSRHIYSSVPGRLSVLAMLLISVSACSITGKLGEGEYALARNDLLIQGPDRKDLADLQTYLIQQPSPIISPGTDPVIFSDAAVKESEKRMLTRLQYLGYYGSTIDSETYLIKKKAFVRYFINPGKKYTISDISFKLPAGESFASDFYSDTSSMVIRKGSELSQKLLEEESIRASAHLRSIGYYGISKNNFFFEADTLGGTAKLEISVHSYTRDDAIRRDKPLEPLRIGAVRISRDASFPFKESVLRELTTLRPGDLYNENDVNTTYRRLSAVRAFSSVGVTLTERLEEGLLDCDISLSKSKSQGFKANIEASTNSSGLVGISPQLTFFHKNIFHGGEQLSLGFMGNFQFRLDDDVRADEYGFSAGLKFPRFLGLPYSLFRETAIPSTEIKASYNYQNRPEYTRSIISTSFGYSGVLKNRFTYQFYPIQLNIVKLWSLDDSFYSTLLSNPYMKYAYQDHFDAGLGGTLYYATSLELNPKVTYSYARFDFDLSGNVVSLLNSALPTGSSGSRLIWGTPYTQYIRGQITLGKTWRVGRDDRCAVATRVITGAGYAYGNSSAMPYEKQFYCGGAGSLRGWQARSVGPGSSKMDTGFIIPSQTGDLKLEANAEFRYPLFWKLEGALFADAGNVWTMSTLKDEDFLRTIAADWGTGVRCDLGFIVVRVDVGFKVYDPSKEAGERFLQPISWIRRNGFALHFGVGYPF